MTRKESGFVARGLELMNACVQNARDRGGYSEVRDIDEAALTEHLTSLQSAAEGLEEALKEERRLRLLGQSPECGLVHWESLRDIRRSAYDRTDAALAAYQAVKEKQQ